jgi:hypothetical protein
MGPWNLDEEQKPALPPLPTYGVNSLRPNAYDITTWDAARRGRMKNALPNRMIPKFSEDPDGTAPARANAFGAGHGAGLADGAGRPKDRQQKEVDVSAPMPARPVRDVADEKSKRGSRRRI